jgi:outer membrane cobalamin receptor
MLRPDSGAVTLNGTNLTAIPRAALARSRLAVFARVTNLFDRAYEDVLGYPALGRAAMAGVRVAAGR